MSLDDYFDLMDDEVRFAKSFKGLYRAYSQGTEFHHIFYLSPHYKPFVDKYYAFLSYSIDSKGYLKFKL